jgi:Protein of unknown function (DUF4232)
MRTVAHRLRVTLVVVPLATLVVPLVACGYAAPGATGPQAAGAGTSGIPLPSTPTDPTTPRQSKAPTPIAGAGSTHLSSGGRCTTGQLHVDVAPGDNAAGHIGLLVVFTNTSTRICTIYGYPGVSFVTGHADQVNDPAQRVSRTPSLVTLAPQGKAHASLLLVNVNNYVGTSNCQATLAAGVRVYPPDDTTALFASSPQWICDVKGTGVPEIYPVQAGASDS